MTRAKRLLHTLGTGLYDGLAVLAGWGRASWFEVLILAAYVAQLVLLSRHWPS